MSDLQATLAEQSRTHVRAARCTASVGVRRCALPAGHLYDHTLTPADGTFVTGPSVVLVPVGVPHITAAPATVPASLTEIANGFAQLVSDGVPESVVLLTVARRAVDAASSQIAALRIPAAVTTYRRLADVSRDLVMLRDGLDELLHVAASSTAPSAKNTRLTDAQRIEHTHAVMTRPDVGKPAKKKRAPNPLGDFIVGQFVDVLDADANAVTSWRTGKVIKISTRLHVAFQCSTPTATGHMAYDVSKIRRGEIKAHPKGQPMLRGERACDGCREREATHVATKCTAERASACALIIALEGAKS